MKRQFRRGVDYTPPVRTCKECGVEFCRISRGPAVYCSPECVLAGKAKAKRADRAANPDKYRAYSAAYRNRNAEKVRERQAAYYAANPDARLRARVKRMGITVEDYEAMRKAQRGRCAICGTSDSGKREWAVDHDHSCCPEAATSCGKCVRGLLCGDCNLGLGKFRDDPQVLRAAIDYLTGDRRARTV